MVNWSCLVHVGYGYNARLSDLAIGDGERHDGLRSDGSGDESHGKNGTGAHLGESFESTK